MTVYTVLYAILKKETFNPCMSSAAFWVWTFTPVPVLGFCMYLIAM